MADEDLSRRLGAVVGAPRTLDVDRLRADARRARGRRRVVAGLAAVALLIPIGLAVERLPGLGREATTAFDETGALAPFDPVTDVAPGVVALEHDELQAQPTRLPEGAVRCAGPEPRASDGVIETVFCIEEAPVLRLLAGNHEQLQERGEVVAVARRDGYLDDGPTLTVSDGNTLADTHHRLEGGLAAATLAEVAASIPVIADGPPSSR